jgi:hypothetical protein
MLMSIALCHFCHARSWSAKNASGITPALFTITSMRP